MQFEKRRRRLVVEGWKVYCGGRKGEEKREVGEGRTGDDTISVGFFCFR
jgi:hypothetical protein